MHSKKRSKNKGKILWKRYSIIKIESRKFKKATDVYTRQRIINKDGSRRTNRSRKRKLLKKKTINGKIRKNKEKKTIQIVIWKKKSISKIFKRWVTVEEVWDIRARKAKGVSGTIRRIKNSGSAIKKWPKRPVTTPNGKNKKYLKKKREKYKNIKKSFHKAKKKIRKIFFVKAGETGFEPASRGTTTQYSTVKLFPIR